MMGLLNYKTESNPLKIWMPKDSEFVKNAKWLENTYPSKIRFGSDYDVHIKKKLYTLKLFCFLNIFILFYRQHSVIVTASNVLRPEVLRFVS